MEDYNELIQQRFKTLSRDQRDGYQALCREDLKLLVRPRVCSTNMETRPKKILSKSGWNHGRRPHRRHAQFRQGLFLPYPGRSGRIQLYFQKNTLGEEQYALFKKIDIGDFIGVKGFLFRTKTNELTIDAEKFTLFSNLSGRCPKNGTA